MLSILMTNAELRRRFIALPIKKYRQGKRNESRDRIYRKTYCRQVSEK